MPFCSWSSHSAADLCICWYLTFIKMFGSDLLIIRMFGASASVHRTVLWGCCTCKWVPAVWRCSPCACEGGWIFPPSRSAAGWSSRCCRCEESPGSPALLSSAPVAPHPLSVRPAGHTAIGRLWKTPADARMRPACCRSLAGSRGAPHPFNTHQWFLSLSPALSFTAPMSYCHIRSKFKRKTTHQLEREVRSPADFHFHKENNHRKHTQDTPTLWKPFLLHKKKQIMLL